METCRNVKNKAARYDSGSGIDSCQTILPKDRISRHQSKLLGFGLGNQESVERVGVVYRQSRYQIGVAEGYRQLEKARLGGGVPRPVDTAR